MSGPLLQVRDLKKYFPIYGGVFRRHIGDVRAVDGINFSIDEGEVLGVVGESGSGKSTAGRTAVRLLQPTAGQIIYRGQDFLQVSAGDLRSMRREIQMIFQDPYSSLNPRKSIAESIGEPLTYHNLVDGRAERDDAIADVLKQVGMSPDIMNRYPHEFSGGQQQRICIGRAIALKPKLIVCDEVVSALDVSIQAQILNLLHELKETMGLSYLFISHDLAVVRHLCDRVAVMFKGKIVESGPAEQVFDSPKHTYTQSLLSAIPVDHPRNAARYATS